LKLDELISLDCTKLSSDQKVLVANLILSRSGSDKFGNKKRKKKGSGSQRYFERSILMTPMGNRMR